MLNSLEKTYKLKFDSCVAAVKILTSVTIRTLGRDFILRCWHQSILELSKLV